MSKSLNFFSYLVIIVTSVFIGLRFYDVGTDTKHYINHFNKSALNGYYDWFEPGFNVFLQVFSKLGISVELFFIVVGFVITLNYIVLYKCISKYLFKRTIDIDIGFFVIFSLLLLSSWYITNVTNGIRQGLSLSFLYLSIYFLLFPRRYYTSFILFCVSISFHYSSLIILPFVGLLLLKFQFLSIVWIFLSVGYLFGVNEVIVYLLSNISGLGVYEFIKFYSLEDESDTGMYSGFILGFYIYTVFWPIFLYLIYLFSFKYKSKAQNRESVVKILSIYMVLSLPYFVFGFGPFSNRFAIMAWFFIPILQMSIIAYFNFNFKAYFATLFLLSSFSFFILVRLDWFRLFSL